MAVTLMEIYQKILDQGFTRKDECIISKTGSTGEGYRRVSLTRNGVRKTYNVHRTVYEVWHGPIPEGLVVDHKCHNEVAGRDGCHGGKSCHHRACVNPAHLRAVTSRENVTSSALFMDKAFTWKTVRVPKTHCPQGHEYSGDNIAYYKNVYRCRECAKQRARDQRKAKRKMKHDG